MLPVNIRAASWLAAECVDKFALDNRITSQALTDFANHLRMLAQADDFTVWDSQGNDLQITGMGDPLPSELCNIEGLNELVCAAREVSASQIYGAFVPEEVERWLRHTIHLSQLDLGRYNLEALCSISPEPGGFGSPIQQEVINEFKLSPNGRLSK